MKILHVGKYFPPYAGGMETYLRDLMVAQRRDGIDTAALVHQSDISLTSQEEQYTVGDQRLPVTRAAVWARFLFTPISPVFPWLLHRMIRQRQPDILHLHLPNVSAFWALLLPAARKIPWVVQWQSDVPASGHSKGLRLFYLLYSPLERAVLKRCKAIIASSPPYLESSLPLREFRDKCLVVPLGLDPKRMPAASECDTADKSLRVLAIGRLTYYKGFEYLIRATAQCENLDVHLVGTGHEEAKLKSLATDLNINDRITFHGHLPTKELATQFSACDCLCLPSIERTEAFGMVLLEAMCCGKATIVSDLPESGMSWVVDDGITGLCVPPEDVDALAAAIDALQQDRDKIGKLGKAGREKFCQLFHIDTSATSVSELYEKVLDTSSAGAPKTLP